MYYYRRCIARKAFYISIITPSICLLVTCGQMLGTFRSDDASGLEADSGGGSNSKDCPFKAAACEGKMGGKKKKKIIARAHFSWEHRRDIKRRTFLTKHGSAAERRAESILRLRDNLSLLRRSYQTRLPPFPSHMICS